MKTVAIGNAKGGVGKSALAINLAVLASQDSKAALLDLDEGQLSSLDWARERREATPLVEEARPARLATRLDELHRQKYKWAFLDLPGRADVAVSAGLKEADFLLVPTRPFDVDISASYEVVQRAERAKLPYAFVLNMVPSNQRGKEATLALSVAGYAVCPVMITQRLPVVDSLGEGLGVCERHPRNGACEEFRALFEWLKRKTR